VARDSDTVGETTDHARYKELAVRLNGDSLAKGAAAEVVPYDSVMTEASVDGTVGEEPAEHKVEPVESSGAARATACRHHDLAVLLKSKIGLPPRADGQ
jgi:hypothetical protein